MSTKHSGDSDTGANNRLRWLDGKAWRDVSREERYFCAELFQVVRSDVGRFIQFLNKEKDYGLDSDANWQAAYEVCFYRDWNKHMRSKRVLTRALQKRTFDLTLFSDKAIVLFEAKAQGSFGTEQLKYLCEDQKRVKKWVGVEVLHTAGIKSSEYEPRDATVAKFSLRPLINWCELAAWYDEDNHVREAFRRADQIYRN